MSFNSINFLIFFPIVVLVYFALPKKIKNIWLLISSYFFYMCWNPKYAIILATCTAVTYLSGILMDKVNGQISDDKKKKRNKKLILLGSVMINFLFLFYFKYLNFAISTFTELFKGFGISLNVPQFDIILPVGISFFLFQALSYSIDVYRNDTKVEKNFIKYALFVSFFPQLVAGPIEKSKNLLKQLDKPKTFDFSRARDGFLLMLWGYFLKLVIADRVAYFVDTVYNDYSFYSGMYLIIATLLFAVQIYCDFAGYSTIAIGAAKILGIDLTKNFDSPYLSTSISSFWKRWHISLSDWFKDYIYIPLGGNKKGIVRKCINKLIVFLISGLWHGANITFVIWGLLNGLFVVISDLLKQLFKKFNTKGLSKVLLKVCGFVVTFVLVNFTWIFFRAPNMMTATNIINSIFTTNNFNILHDGSIYSCGLDIYNFWLAIICIAVLLIVDICNRRGFAIREMIAKQKGIIRCTVIAVSIVFILTFGIWGSSYNAQNFIYFQF